jgi:hypothetical protein
MKNSMTISNTADTFLEMFKSFDKSYKKQGVDGSRNLKQRFLDEVWASRLDNKIERVNYDNMLKKKQKEEQQMKKKEQKKEEGNL